MIRCGWVLTDLAGGGAERIPLLLAPVFRDTEVEVLLLKNRIEHEIPVDGPRVVTLSSGEPALPRAWVPILARAARKARSFDVLVAGLEWAPTFFAVASAALVHKPVVATVHTDLRRYREIEPLPSGWWSAMRQALRRCAAVVVVSENVGESVLDLGVDDERIRVIPNPVSPFAGQRTAELGRARILTVASLKPIKGLELALDTAARLNDLDFQWTIVGGGPQSHSLQTRAKELGLEGRVKFVGFQSDPTPFYAAADIYVLPSRIEGLPLALLEAMSAGIPVIATRCGSGVETLVSDVAGDLVPTGDPAAMADAVRSLLRDPERRRLLGNAGREHARAFDPRVVAQQYDHLFAAVVSEHRASRLKGRRG